MKKLFFISATLFLITLLFGAFGNVYAEDILTIDTLGYSVLGNNSFVFSGRYSDNLNQKDFTTYFEYKKGDSNFDFDKEETIKIVHKDNVTQSVHEYGVFYTSPELDLYSLYYFRAVGYFNSNPEQKFYGNVMSLKTGEVIIKNIPYMIWGVTPICSQKQFLNEKGICENLLEMKIPSSGTVCPLPSVLDKDSGICKVPISLKDIPDPKCESNQKLVVYNKGKDNEYKLCEDNYINKDTKNSGSNNNSGSNSKSSETGLVPCTDDCGFNDIGDLIKNIINFILFQLALPLAAIMFAYAGFELVVSGGEAEKRGKAKKIFTNVAIGLIIVAAAWLIVNAVLSIVGYTGTNFLK